MGRNSFDQAAIAGSSFDSGFNPDPIQAAGSKSGFDTAGLDQAENPVQLVQPTPATGLQGNALSSNMNQCKPPCGPFFPSTPISLSQMKQNLSLPPLIVAGFSDAWLTAQNHFHDMHNYNHNYMIAPEVTNEFNLLNDFLHTSLLDDGALLPDDQNQVLGNQPDVSAFLNNTNEKAEASLLPPSAMQSSSNSMPPPPQSSNMELGRGLARPPSTMTADKARDYIFQAADPDSSPGGNDTPEERMQRVLRAKFDAGLLRPFNYIKGYARLSTYLETHVATASRQKISRQLNRFRPTFREKSQSLTDMDLVFVEMWFEKTLLEYDRVFASMAVPACCWRRTGEIFRGNKEMAELINVPVERLRDVS
jgi:hypothetical protein